MSTLDEAGKMGQVCWIKNENDLGSQAYSGSRRRGIVTQRGEFRWSWKSWCVGMSRESIGPFGAKEILFRVGVMAPRAGGSFVRRWRSFIRGCGEMLRAWGDGGLKFPTWEEALAKQTERVRGKVAKAGDLPQRVVAENCQKRCLKAVLWAGEKPIS